MGDGLPVPPSKLTKGEDMRKLGLIGGVGPESTVPYYMGVLNGVRDRMAALDPDAPPFLPNVTIESLSCFEVMRMAADGQTKELEEYLLAGIESLAGAGCDVAALCCVTGHLVYDELVRRAPIPLVSLVEALRQEVLSQGYRRTILLGTPATMRESFVRKPLAASGVMVLVPGEADRAWIGEAIANELEYGIVRDETVARFDALIRHGREHGADSAILGCTELPLVAEHLDIDMPFVDAAQVHIRALVDAIL